MIPILYPREEEHFTSNGIGALTECISCLVSEERNGIYELVMQYPADGKWFSQLKRGRYIYTSHDETKEPQAFQIYKITKPIDGVCTYYAEHISYQLNKIVVKPFDAFSCTDAMQSIENNAMIHNNFHFSTDKAVVAEWNVRKPTAIRALLGGQENSILDVYGTGEYEFDMFDVKLLLHRGSNTGVTIRYGKNLTEFSLDENYSETYTAIAPYWEDTSGEEDSVVLPEGYLVLPNVPISESNLITDNSLDLLTDNSQTIDVDYYDVEVVPLDMTSEFSSKPTVNELRDAAMEKLQTMSGWKPSENLKINFVNLWETEEYADYEPLEKVKLCDTVSVYFTQLGVTASNMKVIKVTWDALNERYTAMELGEPKTSFSDVITATVSNEINHNEKIELMDSYAQSVLTLFTSGMGLFISKEQKPGGGYQFFLHNQPKREESKYQWSISARGFEVSQDYGRTWSAGIDAEGNAVFNVMAANVVKAMEIYGAYIEGAKIVFAPESKGAVTARGVKYTDGWGGVLFEGAGDFTVSAGTIGLTAKGRPNASNEFQLVGDDGYGHLRNFVSMNDESLYIAHYTEEGAVTGTITVHETDGITIRQNKADGTSKVTITMHPTNGLGIYIDGLGYNGLGFVNDGQGHAVLGK